MGLLWLVSKSEDQIVQRPALNNRLFNSLFPFFPKLGSTIDKILRGSRLRKWRIRFNSGILPIMNASAEELNTRVVVLGELAFGL